MRSILIAAAAALLGVSFVGASPGRARSDLVVHEWGTFLAMNGSDGVSLDGMYHEEHALPAFVQSRSKDQRRLDEHEVALARNPRSRGSQLALAYLYEARGDARRAQTMWAAIDPARQTGAR
jgi:hypothetical protein